MNIVRLSKIGLAIFAFFMLISYWDRPTVYFKPGGHCVKVYNSSGKNYDCGNLPEEFNRVEVNYDWSE